MRKYESTRIYRESEEIIQFLLLIDISVFHVTSFSFFQYSSQLCFFIDVSRSLHIPYFPNLDYLKSRFLYKLKCLIRKSLRVYGNINKAYFHIFVSFTIRRDTRSQTHIHKSNHRSPPKGWKWNVNDRYSHSSTFFEYRYHKSMTSKGFEIRLDRQG